MKQLCFFILGICFISNAYCQSYSEYQRRGDQAMEAKDFVEARMYYSEGLANESCDFYSISKLTEIWKIQPEMRKGMKSIITRCYNCLVKLSTSEEKNANVMFLLVDYYNEGIGIEKDSLQAESVRKELWKSYGYTVGTDNEPSETKVDTVFQIVSEPVAISPDNAQSKIGIAEKYHLFATYTFSPTMPVGFTIGGFDKLGVILSFKTSTNKKDYSYTCNNSGNILEIPKDIPYTFDDFETFKKDEKWHSWMVTGGILIPVIAKKLFLSTAVGYGERSFYCKAYSPEKIFNGQNTAWCYNSEASYKGAVVELGGLYKYKHIIFTGGINTIAFRDMDMYLGLGLSF